MKKLHYLMSILLACILSVGHTSCSSNQSGGSTPTPPQPLDINDIVGTWLCTFSVDNYQGMSHPGLMVGKQVTINENGTYTSTSPSFGYSGTFTQMGNTITTNSTAGSYTIVVTVIDNSMHWSGSSATGATFEYDFTRESNDNNSTIDIQKFVGTWICTSSIDVVESEMLNGLMVDKQVNIKSDGTYTSNASSFGSSGTFTAEDNYVKAQSNAGTFIIYPVLSDDTMTWIGSSDNGVLFKYAFQKK